MSTCEHLNFAANVAVGRITRGEGGPVGSYLADVTVKCADCGRDFEFIGLPMGIDLNAPTMSVGGLEARLPIRPAGDIHMKPSDAPSVRFSVTGPIE